MTDKVCERCGSPPDIIPEGPFAGYRGMLDYCAECSKDLCDDCMKNGCCGHVPALSGTKEDNEDDDEGIARDDGEGFVRRSRY